MPLRPPACCRAVHRRVSSSPDPIWITDDILSNVFSKFCANNKPTRRYGSNVPGPMEARRILGKRKIAYMAEMEPPTHALLPWRFDFQHSLRNGLQKVFGSEDKREAQWDLGWEPPNRSIPKTKSELPTWITDYNPPPLQEDIFEPVLESDAESVEAPLTEEVLELAVDSNVKLVQSEVFPLHKTIKDELSEFRKLLASTNKNSHFCEIFNEKTRQNILLGLMSEEDLAYYLKNVPVYLNKSIPKKTQRLTHALSFFKVVCEGMTSCKVMSIEDFGDKVLERLTSLLFKSWSHSWKHGLLRDSLNSSILAFTNVLNLVPPEKGLQILQDLTAQLGKQKTVDELLGFRYALLKMGSHMKWIDEPMFIQLWQFLAHIVEENLEGREVKEVTRQKTDVRGSECCDVILSHWVNHDIIKNPDSVVNTLDTLMLDRVPEAKLSCFIASLDKHRELAWTKTVSLFRILKSVGLYSKIYETLKHLPSLGIEFPASIIAPEIKDMTLVDFDEALRIYKIYPKIRIDRICLTTKLDDLNSDFYIQMIKTKIPPENIWALLRIPLFRTIWKQARRPRYTRGFKTLHPARISLIRRMAVEFALAEHLTPREARRNVTQCLLYLKTHRVSIVGKPDLGRAVVHAGITRELAQGKWVGTATLIWVLRWVEWAEGKEARERLEMVLISWRTQYIEKQNWMKRDRNPLRVGPID